MVAGLGRSPKRLFDEDAVGIKIWEEGSPIQRSYDVSSDGQQFVMIEMLEETTSNLVVVENWYEEFRDWYALNPLKTTT